MELARRDSQQTFRKSSHADQELHSLQSDTRPSESSRPEQAHPLSCDCASAPSYEIVMASETQLSAPEVCRDPLQGRISASLVKPRNTADRLIRCAHYVMRLVIHVH